MTRHSAYRHRDRCSRDIRHRLAGLAVDRNAIRFKRYFGIVVSDDLAVLGQHVDDLRLITVGGGGCDVGCDDRIGTDARARPVPVVHERLHGDVAPIVIVISAAGGAVFLIPDPVADGCQAVGHCGKPGKEFFSPFCTKVEVTGLGTPGADLSAQFDIDRYLVDGCRDVVAIEIADEAVRPDPDVATGPRCVEELRAGVEKLLKGAAIRQGNVDGDPGREWTGGADIGLSVENHDDGRTIVEMGIKVPPFIAAALRADALTVLKLRYLIGGDAKSLVIGGTIRQAKAAILAAMHGYSLLRRSRCQAGRPSFLRYIGTSMVSALTFRLSQAERMAPIGGIKATPARLPREIAIIRLPVFAL